MVKIKPLTKTRLKEAVNLVNEIFPEEEKESPSDELSASLFSERYGGFLSKNKMSNIEYWLAIDSFGKIAGTVGLYCYEKDKDEAVWLGWFCVTPALRRNGIGTRLLQFSIKQAKKRGKKFLRLWTSADSDKSDARLLYEKYGFLPAKEGQFDDDNKLKYLYCELKLR